MLPRHLCHFRIRATATISLPVLPIMPAIKQPFIHAEQAALLKQPASA